jgi:transposase
VLWADEGRRRKDIAELAGVSAQTVDRTKARYAKSTVAVLMERKRGGGKEQVPPRIRGRVIALTRMTPPPESGLSHWSARTLADHLKWREGIKVSFHYVARIWREENLKPNRNGANFLPFPKRAVKPHAGKEIPIVLDNLFPRTTLEVMAWLEKNPRVHFHFTPHRLFLPEPDRDLVRDHPPALHPSRHVLQRPRPGQVDPYLHRLLEPEARNPSPGARSPARSSRRSSSSRPTWGSSSMTPRT